MPSATGTTLANQVIEKPAILSENAILTPDEKADLEKQLEVLS